MQNRTKYNLPTNHLFVCLLLLSILIISGCGKYSGVDCGEVSSNVQNKGYECFVSNLKDCSPSKLSVNIDSSNDVQVLELLGKESGECMVSLYFKEMSSEELKVFEGKYFVCLQENMKEFENLADEKGEDAMNLVNSLREGIVAHTVSGSEVCKIE